MTPQSYQLLMRSGPNSGKSFELNKTEIYIGRDISNDIVINDSEVSRKHARLILQSGGYVLEDLGSTNGTFVNGQRLMGPHVLRPGELVMLGENISLTFQAGFDADATMVAPSAAPETYSPPPPQENYPPPAPQAGPPPPAYAGQIPPGPVEPYQEPYLDEEKKSNRTWIWVGCGCLVVLLCVVVGGAYAFDSLNLYCKAPFNTLFSFLYTCP